MRDIVQFTVETVPMDWDTLFNRCCLTHKTESAAKLGDLFGKAKEYFLAHWRPAGIISDVTIENFEEIFFGEGNNEVPNPLDSIFRKADSLALYVVTSGREMDERIASLADSSRLTLAYMLDFIASEATEVIAEAIQNYHRDKLARNNLLDNRSKVLRYSPGYCGWDISAQRKIFQYLKPEDIGVSLNEGYLMSPLKSTSGVIVSGPAEIHEFEDNFIFCKKCKTRNCRVRLKA